MSDQLPPGASNAVDGPTMEGDPVAPTMLAGKYRVERVIGEGSFGRVYLATDPRLRRNVAVKELLSARQSDRALYEHARERFEREARAASIVQHPNIVSVYELAVDNADNYYLVMEYVDGTDLRGLLMQVGTLPPERVIALALDIARALGEIHARDIVHRDLKPANIMLTRRGVAKLTDFGVAQVGSESQRTTVTSGHPGTPMYMSPEQSRSTGYLDGRSDLYSLGLVMYEMLVGTPYVRSRRPLDAVRPDLPPSLVAVVNRLSAPNPDDRYPEAGEVVAALEGLSARRGSLEPMPLPPRSDGETRIAGPASQAPQGLQGPQGAPGYGGAFPPANTPQYRPPQPQYRSAPPPQQLPYGSVPPQYGNAPLRQPQPSPAYPAYGPAPGQDAPPQYGQYAAFPPRGPAVGGFPPPGAPPYPPPPQPVAPKKGGRGPLIAIGAVVALLALFGILAAIGSSSKDTTTTATPGSIALARVGTTTAPAGSGMNVIVPATFTLNGVTPAPMFAAATPVPTLTAAMLPGTSRPASSTTLTTWSDTGGNVKLQYPAGWKESRDSGNTDNELKLTADNVSVFVNIDTAPLGTLDDEIVSFRKTHGDANKQFTYTYNTPAMTRVGGETARSISYSFVLTGVANDKPSQGTYWVVDHKGKRYLFQCSDLVVHNAEIQAMIASVTFLK